MTATDDKPATTTAAPDRSRKAIRGAFLGFLVDNFDIYLPLVALGPAMIYFLPADLPPETAALMGSWIFAATLIARPLGSFIFGSLADAIGRRTATLIAVAGFGVATLLMALLPGYATWGLGAAITLTALRFIGGVMLGGEYSGANVLAMEESPRQRRGINGAIVQSGATLAFILLTLITLALLAILPWGEIDSAYTRWGWRIPFLIGGLMAFGFLVYYAHEVEESSLWKKSEHKTRTRKIKLSGLELLRGEAGRNFAQVFVMMTGMWLLLLSVTAIMPGILGKQLELTSSQVTTVVLGIFIALTLVYLAGGALSQLIGRRTYLIGSAVLALLGGGGTLLFLIVLEQPSLRGAMVPAVIASSCLVAPWAVVTSYLAERFKTANRAVGFGLGYSLAVILPSFYATYQLWLSAVMPAGYTVIVLVVLGAALTAAGAAAGPETKDIDFSKAEQL